MGRAPVELEGCIEVQSGPTCPRDGPLQLLKCAKFSISTRTNPR